MWKIRFTKLLFRVQMVERCELPEYKVSALRGGMGQMLLSQNCINNDYINHCEDCGYNNSCLVQKIMYAPFKLEPQMNMPTNSLGYIIDCLDMRTHYNKGDILEFEITLFGDTISLVMPVIYAITSLGAVGIGKNHAGFQLVSIKNRKEIPILYQGSISLNNLLLEQLQDYVEERMGEHSFSGKVVFDSPCCIKHNGKEITNITPEAMVLSLKRRIYMLSMYEGINMELPHYDVSELPEVVRQKMCKKTVSRYSTTSQRHMKLNGIQGNVWLDHCNGDILRLLYAGEIIHIGKNVHLGFGSIKVE